MTTATRATLADLSAADRETFVAALGGIFEHSPWIADAAWAMRPFASVDALHQAMVAVLRAAPPGRQLLLIRAHPELAGKEAAAGTLTVESKGEQASAGLDRCTAEELARLRAMNRAYRDKYGFPFVMAVKHKTKNEILGTLETRLNGSAQTEFQRCLEEIEKIARQRLTAMFEQR